MRPSIAPRSSLPLNLSSWIAFAISLTFYWITADPGVSYWDCAEYVTAASKLEVGHPPGNPVWMLAMRVATIPFPAEYHAYVINLFSGLFMAFATFFLCRVIFVVLEGLKGSKTGRYSNAEWVIGMVSMCGSLCFALCDSAWFSAVEAEVYAMSAFLTALSLWIMAVWWTTESHGKRIRLLVLLAYLTGLSLGVHQLNLLLIPVFTLLIIYRYNPGKINPFKLLAGVIASILFVGLILFALIPGVLAGAKTFELFGVNTMGLPYHYGAIGFIILLSGLLIGIIIFSRKKNVALQTGALALLLFLIGYSSYSIILIRANAYPPMNEGVPDNIFSLASYISREQYPSAPLVFGRTPYSRPMFEEKFIDGKPVYSHYILKKSNPVYKPVSKDAILHHRSGMLSHKDSVENQKVLASRHGYLLEDYGFNQLLTPELDMWFPRITSGNPADILAYEDWAGMSESNMQRVSISETIDSLGNFRTRMYPSGVRDEVYSYRPTYLQHLRFFIAYQAYYMYFRYLFWNFIGRQNDFPSNGEIEHGNFITGFTSFDAAVLGDTPAMPAEIGKANKGRNIYYGIPFLLGIIGILWLLGTRKKRRVLALNGLFFFMTGLAIVIYLNQSPGEPRERDYTFLGSYMAFAIWIASGMSAFFDVGRRRLRNVPAYVICALFSFGTPILMAIENFDDHDRRGRYEPSFYASSILDFEYPSIIFSHGDNSTFPIWYATEVLGKGKTHTPVDVTYLSLPSYVENLKKQGNNGIFTIASTPEIAYGKYVFTRIPEDSVSEPLPLGDALRILYSSGAETPVFPSSRIVLPDKAGDSVTISLRDFTRGSNYLSFKHLMLLDIIAAQLDSDSPKGIFFPYLIGRDFYKPLDDLLIPVLFGKIYAPWLPDSISAFLTEKSLEREFVKLQDLNPGPHYADPVILDRTRRYRGELIIAADQLLESGDTATTVRTVDFIQKYYPYSTILPGDFTISDTTYYEGKGYVDLLKKLYKATGENKYRQNSEALDSLMDARHFQWLKYYQSLPLDQRQTFSNRSKRLLIKRRP